MSILNMVLPSIHAFHGSLCAGLRSDGTEFKPDLRPHKSHGTLHPELVYTWTLQNPRQDTPKKQGPSFL